MKHERGDTIITARVLNSGQPRPYADSRTTVQLYFERIGWASLEPSLYAVPIETARAAAAGSLTGYTYKTKDQVEMFGTYLSYFLPVKDGMHVYGQIEEGARYAVWEFQTITPFTD